MIEQIQNSEEVIVWIPFVVRREHLRATAMTSMPTQPQSILVRQALQEEPLALPPPSARNVPPESKPRKGMASPRQREFIYKLADKLNMTESEICSVTGAKSIEQMSNAQANEFISRYKDAKPQF